MYLGAAPVISPYNYHDIMLYIPRYPIVSGLFIALMIPMLSDPQPDTYLS